jgi:hypothetical protein
VQHILSRPGWREAAREIEIVRQLNDSIKTTVSLSQAAEIAPSFAPSAQSGHQPIGGWPAELVNYLSPPPSAASA